MLKLRIRKASVKDLQTVLALQNKMVDEERKFMSSLDKKGKIFSYSKGEIKKILTSPNCYLTIAEINKIPVGCGFARIENTKEGWLKYKKQGYLGMLFIEKKYRRKGIAEKLQKERIHWLKSKKVKFCVNKILAKNIPSLNLQIKRGFKPIIIKMYKELK